MTVFAPALSCDTYAPDSLELEQQGWTRRPAGDAVYRKANPEDAEHWLRLEGLDVMRRILVCYATGRLKLLEYEILPGKRLAPGITRFWGWCADKNDFTTALRMVGWEPWPSSIPA